MKDDASALWKRDDARRWHAGLRYDRGYLAGATEIHGIAIARGAGTENPRPRIHRRGDQWNARAGEFGFDGSHCLSETREGWQSRSETWHQRCQCVNVAKLSIHNTEARHRIGATSTCELQQAIVLGHHDEARLRPKLWMLRLQPQRTGHWMAGIDRQWCSPPFQPIGLGYLRIKNGCLRRAASVLPQDGGQQRFTVPIHKHMRVHLRAQSRRGNHPSWNSRCQHTERFQHPCHPMVWVLFGLPWPQPGRRVGAGIGVQRRAIHVEQSRFHRRGADVDADEQRSGHAASYALGPGRFTRLKARRSPCYAFAFGRTCGSNDMALFSLRGRTCSAVAGVAALVLSSTAALAAGKVAVITPYLAQPGTQFYVEAFQEQAKANGWEVNVIDTKGDVAAVISRLEDVSNQKVDAIVINVDPGQVAAGLETAKAAGVPVFGMDAGASPLLVTNITSNGYSMAADTAAYVANRINGKGNVVMFVFDAFPPVQQRGVIADAIFKNTPDIKVLDRVTPDVSDGGIADSRAKMEAILAANPEKGSISAVWAAWDQPAIGALQAIEAAGRGEEGIVITGIDANPQAREAIAKGGNFEASMAQDFKGIGKATADAVKRHLGGEKIRQAVIYVPTKLITAANVKE